MPFSIKIGRRRKRLLIQSGIVIAVGCLFTLLAVFVQPFTSINWWLSDQLFVPEPPSPNIVIAGVDDATLNTYGKWAEWPRKLHAQAIDNLRIAGAGVIGYDVLFTDVSTDDQMLAEAIESAGDVVLPVVGINALPAKNDIITYGEFLSPTEPLQRSSVSQGHANIVVDGDGIVRRLPLIATDSSGQIYPAFALSVLHVLFSKELPSTYSIENGTLHLLDRNIPVDETGNLRINFTSSTDSYIQLSYGDIVAGNFDPSIVKHKIVLVGMTATGESDAWRTPASTKRMPGVWIHANTIDTILRQRFLIDAGLNTTALVMLFLVLVTGLALPRMKLKWGGVLVVGLFASYLLSVFLVFDNGYIINILYPLMLLPLAYVANIFCVVSAEQSDRQLVRGLFGRYVSTQVATEILQMADSGKLELGGEQRTVTVLFADIRGFTELCEQMAPEEVVSMLNNYLSIIIERLIASSGMINKFAGDNVMAVWNAPQYQNDHARLAVKAAWEVQQAILELQRNNPSLRRVQFGIGINTGGALVGNVGSAGRAEYTVIGDAVNLASRICSSAPGGEVWVGSETYLQIADYVDVEELEPQSYKGKTDTVSVYRVIGLR